MINREILMTIVKNSSNRLEGELEILEINEQQLHLINKELNKLVSLHVVSQQRELLLQAYKDGFQAATDSIFGANEMVKNKTLQ